MNYKISEESLKSIFKKIMDNYVLPKQRYPFATSIYKIQDIENHGDNGFEYRILLELNPELQKYVEKTQFDYISDDKAYIYYGFEIYRQFPNEFRKKYSDWEFAFKSINDFKEILLSIGIKSHDSLSNAYYVIPE